MSTVAKFFVVLNLILAVVFLGAASTFLGYMDSNLKKYNDEVTAHGATRGAKEAMEKDLTQRANALSQQVNEANNGKNVAMAESEKNKAALMMIKEQYDVLNSSLQKATAALVIAQNTIQSGRALADELSKDLAVQVAAVKSANDAKDAAVKSQNAMSLQVENMQADMQSLQERLATAQNDLKRTTFRLDAIISQNPGIEGQGAAGGPPLDGKILASDNRLNIVVISLGREDGVKQGAHFTVSRGSSYIAEIEITGTEAKQSAGRAVKTTQKGPINVGDDISSR